MQSKLSGNAPGCSTCGSILCTPGFCPTASNPVPTTNIPDGGTPPTSGSPVCPCTQVRTCGFTDAVVCLPPPGSQDPAEDDYGLLGEMMSRRIEMAVSAPASVLRAQATVPTLNDTDWAHTNFDDTGPDDAHPPHISGDVVLHGNVTPGDPASLTIDFNLAVDDFKFHFPPGVPDLAIEKLTLSGGTGATPLSFDASGATIVAPGQLTMIVNATVVQSPDHAGNGQSQLLTLTLKNITPLLLNVDFAAKTFTMQGQLDLNQISGTFFISGAVSNQPPQADATVKPGPTVECTSPQGTPITLDGSKSCDPDGCDPNGVDDLRGVVWYEGTDLDSDHTVGHSLVQPALAPLGATTYTLFVTDSQAQSSGAQTKVTVQDTAAPEITVAVDPPCLWPPNHSMILYSLGAGLSMSSNDACDGNPALRIVNVVSDQPVLDDGSGNTVPDVRFGTGAFCIRSERDGTSNHDRVYTVTVLAEDGSGNQTTKQVRIVVPHDQGGTGGACKGTLDPSRIVSDDDPRCMAAAPHPFAEHFTRASAPAIATASAADSASGCTVAPFTPRSSVWELAALLGLALAVLMLRSRTRKEK